MQKKSIFVVFLLLNSGISCARLLRSVLYNKKEVSDTLTTKNRSSTIVGAHIWPTKVPFIPYRSARFRYLGAGKKIDWKIYEKDAQGNLVEPAWVKKGGAQDPVFFKNPRKEEMILSAPRHDWGKNGLKIKMHAAYAHVSFVIEAKDDLGQTAYAEVEKGVQPAAFFLPEPLDPFFKHQKGLGTHVLLSLQEQHMFNEFYAVPYLSGVMAPEAWKFQKDCTAFITAVVDNGLDYDHLEFENSVVGCQVKNPAYEGKWFAGLNLYQIGSVDKGDHGTHVAGIIAGCSNGWGILGMCHQARILPIQALTAEEGSGSIIKTTEALQNIALNPVVRVSNFSLGSIGEYVDRHSEEDFDQEHAQYVLSTVKVFEPWIKKIAKNKGILVFAAGNENVNLDLYWTPFSYWMKEHNIISVAATHAMREKSSFSNYGMHTVDVAAPGTAIYSTTVGNHFDFRDGTSMAAPFVSGLAALILSRFPDLTSEQVKARICLTADYVENLDPFVRFGFINAYRALTAHFDPIEGDVSMILE